MTLKRCSVVLLTCLALGACGGVDPDSPLGQRKAIFQQMLKTSEDLGGMLRGRIAFDGPRFSAGASRLDNLAHEPWQHFPEAKDPGPSSATQAVWQQQARFAQLARGLEAATAELAATSQLQPYQASRLLPAVQKVEAACSACHKEFRNH